MPPNLALILRALRASQNESSAPFVFQSKIGAPIDPDAVGAVLAAAQDAAKVRHFGTHGLRHLYCSLLQERAGAALKFAQEKLGHADPQTTARIYTHVVNDQGREFAERVESAFPFPNVSVVLAKPQAVPSGSNS